MLIGCAVWTVSQQRFIANAVEAQAEIIDFVESEGDNGSMYAPVFKFKDAQGQEYTVKSSVGTGNPTEDIGDTIMVLYDPKAPENAQKNSLMFLWLGQIVLGVLGTVFFLIGAVILWCGKTQKDKQAYLKTAGIPVTAKVIDIEYRSNIDVNGVHPYCVVCLWTDPTGNEYVFKSANLWLNPEPFIKNEEVIVYILADNPEKYFVDAQFMPKDYK